MKKSARLKIALLLICPAGTALRADPGTQEVFNSIGSRSISWIAIIPFLLLTALVIFLIITVIMRRRTEMSLRQANLVVENSPAVLFRWRAAPGWPVDFVSKNVIQFGYTVEELVSGLIPLFIHDPSGRSGKGRRGGGKILGFRQ